MKFPPARRWPHRLRNRLQSLLLLGGMSLLLALLGWLLGGPGGLLWSLLTGMLALLLGPLVSPPLVLRLLGAIPIAPPQAPELYAMAASLARRAALPSAPHLYYSPSRALNAFSVGNRNDASIALTGGLLQALGPRELAGVLAHEISHIRNNDLWVMALAAIVGQLTAWLSFAGQILLILMLPWAWLTDFQLPLPTLALMIAAPLLSRLLQNALARTREYEADLGAADLTGDPRGLASALNRLEWLQGGWTERVFMATRHPWPEYLSSHPPMRERIRRLEELASQEPPADFADHRTAALESLSQAARRQPWSGRWN
ncbi:MAG: zinc metalloprotease HtpX [Burkholderiales bacterium]